ncbi:hypothetical protein RclHR1_35030001, partial [Rhizophagus clarus]
TTDQEDANLFSLLDHYDKSQMPDNIGDLEWFDNFIIYMRDLPAVSGECGDTNDCLYQCLKMAYGSYSNMTQSIEKPEYIKDYLNLARNDPISIACIPANKPLDALEAQWISKAMMEGIIWAQNNWKGYGRSYDDTSLYPSIQQSALNFPIDKGKFQILKDFTNHRGYSHFGIFCASIEKKDTPLFQYNYYNIYTHINLIHAKALGLQVTLIQDEAPNALIYKKET